MVGIPWGGGKEKKALERKDVMAVRDSGINRNLFFQIPLRVHWVGCGDGVAETAFRRTIVVAVFDVFVHCRSRTKFLVHKRLLYCQLFLPLVSLCFFCLGWEGGTEAAGKDGIRVSNHHGTLGTGLWG